MTELKDLKEALRRSRSIDRLLATEQKQLDKESRIPCLILGSSDSGKTTLLKQLTLCFGGGFTDLQREAYRVQLWENLVDCFQVLIVGCNLLGLQIAPETDSENAQLILDYQLDPQILKNLTAVLHSSVPIPSQVLNNTPASSMPGTPKLTRPPHRALSPLSESSFFHSSTLTRLQFPPDIVSAMLQLWKNPSIQKGYRRREKIHLQETVEYLFNSLERILDANYVPTDMDILHIRKSNTTVTETRLRIEGNNIMLYDVAGQRGFRKAWIPFFDNAHCILFVMSLNAYDQTLVEDPSINRMMDAMNLFHSIAENPLLQKAALMLFMNKSDLFQKKLKTVSIIDYFPEFKGENSFKNGVRFFRVLFWECKVSPNRTMITHVTTATDPKTMRVLCESVIQTIINAKMQELQLA